MPGGIVEDELDAAHIHITRSGENRAGVGRDLVLRRRHKRLLHDRTRREGERLDVHAAVGLRSGIAADRSTRGDRYAIDVLEVSVVKCCWLIKRDLARFYDEILVVVCTGSELARADLADGDVNIGILAFAPELVGVLECHILIERADFERYRSILCNVAHVPIAPGEVQRAELPHLAVLRDKVEIPRNVPLDVRSCGVRPAKYAAVVEKLVDAPMEVAVVAVEAALFVSAFAVELYVAAACEVSVDYGAGDANIAILRRSVKRDIADYLHVVPA